MKKRAFTIVEMVIALTIFGMLFSAVMTIYTRMINVKREFDARSYLLNTTYTIVEKLNIMLKDYTIDYEEYFNRRMYGCAGTAGLMTGWNQGTTGYCSLMAGYGNQNPRASLQTKGAVIATTGNHHLYRCSSTTNFLEDSSYSYAFLSSTLLTGEGCPLVSSVQSFGEYRWQFVDVKSNADESSSTIGDDDDTDLGKGPVAIPDNQNVPELYLISKDKRTRLFFRRKLVQQNDANNNGTFQPVERLYVIQMLQLRGFDAGTKHTFDAGDSTNLYMYDGQIDTRACDYEKGFICSGTGVNNSIYSGYRLPANADDGWVNLFGGDITVSSWKMEIYPTKDPVYAWSEDDTQINPYIRLSLVTHLYAPSWYTRVDLKILNNISYDLQTMFNIKTNY